MVFYSTDLLRSLLLLVLLITQVCGYIDVQLEATNPAFDPGLYEDALDSELCEKQLEYLSNNTLLRWEFLEAGARIPRGFFIGNSLDLGNYYQCLGINHPFEDKEIQGKYCLVNGPLNENVLTHLKEAFEENLEENGILDIVEKIEENNKAMFALESFSGLNVARLPGTPLEGAQFRVAVCVPKSCTSSRGFQGLLTGIDFGLQFQEQFCRLPDDKPWVPVDYVTIILFSTIGILTLMSTSYDLYYTKMLNKDPKQLSTVYRSFSVYTNTRRLLTFSSNPGSLDCIDGIRSLAMSWVIIGHTFSNQPFWSNPRDTFLFTLDWTSLWITSAHLTVDTFFLLSGLLVVYTSTTTGKLSGMKLIKNIHLFYLNRLLRMFPILATGILLTASIAHKVADGPHWQSVANQANSCRSMWWSTLLYVQNYVSGSTCIGQTWYLAIDMQLHILSPIVLVWTVGSKRKVAWIALAASMLVSLISSTIYNFVNEFPSSMMTPGRGQESRTYMRYYYINTLTRASPFFVGMIFGYLLHTYRGKKLVVPKSLVTILWIFTLALFTTLIYATYPALQFGWDNQVGDSLINSFQRPGWALGLGCLIVACVHGYGGPINWLLSLKLWKLPARISYAMFIVHWSVMTIMNGTRLAPPYFSVGSTIVDFISQYALSFIVSFVITVTIDAPFSIFFKMILEQRPLKAASAVKDKEITKEDVLETGCSATNNGFVNEDKKLNDTEEDNLTAKSEIITPNNGYVNKDS